MTSAREHRALRLRQMKAEERVAALRAEKEARAVRRRVRRNALVLATMVAFCLACWVFLGWLVFN